MRICVVTVSGYVHGIGGMQDHTVDLVRGLVAAGHEVEAITRRHPDGAKSAEFAGARWHFVDAPSARQRLPMRHPAWHRTSAIRFEELHARRPFDLVHSESTSALGLLHCGWHKRVPIAAKFHGNYLSFVRTAIRRIVAGEDAVREAKGIAWNTGAHFLTRGNWYRFRSCEAMVPSRAQLDDTIRSCLLRHSRAHVVPNGIDPDAFSPGHQDEARAQVGLGRGILFIWLGRIYPGKGLDVAIRALARTDAGASLIVVGDGEGRGSAEALAARAGLGERVMFAGSQPRDRIPLYLRSADAFVFPTLLPEAAPLAPLQAMACGTPVLASRIGAVPELVSNPGLNGLLVQPSDVDDLGRNMVRLAADKQLRTRIGSAGRERVLSEYTTERMIERTIAVYELARDRFRSPA
jgi:glycosyltransferase involved in cell wall biosynthesis